MAIYTLTGVGVSIVAYFACVFDLTKYGRTSVLLLSRTNCPQSNFNDYCKTVLYLVIVIITVNLYDAT